MQPCFKSLETPVGVRVARARARALARARELIAYVRASQRGDKIQRCLTCSYFFH